jgi:RND family efflux transporter MFP subunit
MSFRRRVSAIISLQMLLLSTAWGQGRAPRGITEPCRDATLSATVAGTLAVIHKKEGEQVRAGEVILELEKDLESIEVERRLLIAESKVELEAARRRAEQLHLELEATRRLYESTGSVSREQLQQKELETCLAEAELERLSIAEKRELLELRIAEAQLKQRSIAAPFDGLIAEIIPEIGEACYPQQPLVRVVDTSRCRLIVHLEAAAALQLAAGKAVQLRFDGIRPPNLLRGVVELVSPVVDPASGLVEIKVLFDNPEGRVRPGLTGTFLMK